MRALIYCMNCTKQPCSCSIWAVTLPREYKGFKYINMLISNVFVLRDDWLCLVWASASDGINMSTCAIGLNVPWQHALHVTTGNDMMVYFMLIDARNQPFTCYYHHYAIRQREHATSSAYSVNGLHALDLCVHVCIECHPGVVYQCPCIFDSTHGNASPTELVSVLSGHYFTIPLSYYCM